MSLADQLIADIVTLIIFGVLLNVAYFVGHWRGWRGERNRWFNAWFATRLGASRIHSRPDPQATPAIAVGVLDSLFRKYLDNDSPDVSKAEIKALTQRK